MPAACPVERPSDTDLHPDTPSILKQTYWESGFFAIQPRYKTQYFNPGLIDWLGTRWLVARRRRHAWHPGTNDIVFIRLRANLQPMNEYPLKFRVRFADEHWEDPRVIMWNRQPLVSYSNFRTRHIYVHQAAAMVDQRFHSRDFHIAYGQNGASLMENTGNEKNWLYFDYDNRLHMVYNAHPHTVLRVGQTQIEEEYESAGFTWRYGIPRGGTPPVFVSEDGLYWSFFHSSIDIAPIPPRRRYYMGAYAFEPIPPFKVIMATMDPFLIGSGEDPREPSAPYCVFPCGALLDNDMWTVSLGVNDCACAWIKIPHQELRRLAYLV